MRFDLAPYRQGLKGYVELRAHRNLETTVALLNGNLTQNSRSEQGGASARAYANGAWGFASSPELARFPEVTARATRNAEFLGQRESRASFPFAGFGSSEKDHSTKKARTSQAGIVEFLREIDAYLGKYKDLKTRRLSFYGLDVEKTVSNSLGASAYSYVPRAHLGVSLGLEREGATVELRDSSGGLGQFEDHFRDPAALQGMIDELYTKLKAKQEGTYAEAGTHDCILAPDLAGILAHEAVGHTTEADLVQGGSVAGGLLGKQVASPLISLVDYAHTFRGETCPVPVYVDDEGVTAEDAVLIEDGVLKGFMHNRESAARMGMRAQGNARAFDFSDEPLIRMRNTVIVPGKSKLADMIASIEKGYLLASPGSGQADSTGEFMFGVQSGYEIRNGKLGRAILDTTISGVAFEMLKTVDQVSDDMVWISNGFCGKKQRMSVGMGGPAVRCRMKVGGR